MSGAYLHLALTHVPVVGITLGLLLLAYAIFADKKQVLQASLIIFIACGLVAIAVYLTGESAEEVVEHAVGVSETLIEEHEEAGLIALIGAIVLGMLASIGLLWQRPAKWFSGALLVAALITSGIMAWTANLGGQINHPEIRSTAATIQQDSPNTEHHEADEQEEEDE